MISESQILQKIKEKEQLLTQALLHELFIYSEETGILHWKVSRSNAIKVGSAVKYKSKNGYIQVRLLGKLWMAHRLIWCYKTGKFPELWLDHIDGDRSNNRFENLRVVDRSTNMQNVKRANVDSFTQHLGVTFDKQAGKFRAQHIYQGVKVLNKLFRTAEEAHSAYLNSKEKYCD
jgi:hypothetical protein